MFQIMKKFNVPLAIPALILLVFSSCRKTTLFRSSQSYNEQVQRSIPLAQPPAEAPLGAASEPLSSSDGQPEPRPQKPTKKRIVIFSCKGGGGHTASSNALYEYLHDQYEVTIVNLIEDILYPLDPVRTVTRQHYHGSDMYNMLLKANVPLFTNTLSIVGQWAVRWQSSRIEPLIERYLKEQAPDIVISVMPVLNGALVAVTERLGMPFGVIALDRDMVRIGFLNGIKSPTHPCFFFGVPFLEPRLLTIAEAVGISPERVRSVGVPLRKTFFEPRDRNDLRAKLGVKGTSDHASLAQMTVTTTNSSNTKNSSIAPSVITVLMGSAGSKATLRYAKSLARIKRPLHVFLCLGKNEQLRPTLEAIKLPPHITFSIVGFTDRIADYMAVADVLITKPGAVSIFEALVIAVPTIIDNKVLAWEAMGVDLIKAEGFGDKLRLMRRLPSMLNTFLDPAYNAEVRDRMRRYKLPDVMHNVQQLVIDMLASKEQCRVAETTTIES